MSIELIFKTSKIKKRFLEIAGKPKMSKDDRKWLELSLSNSDVVINSDFGKELSKAYNKLVKHLLGQ